MNIIKVLQRAGQNSSQDHDGLKQSSKRAKAPTREELHMWAESQRALYAAGKLSNAHTEALMAIPHWSWESVDESGEGQG
jgi:hypothetical protein